MRKMTLFFLFYLWIAFILAAYYVVQKPIGSIQLQGLTLTLWSLALAALVLIIAAGIGTGLIDWMNPREINPTEKILLGIGLGLGAIGLFGLGLAALGWALRIVFAVITVALLILLWISGKLKQVGKDFLAVWSEIRNSYKSVHFLIKLAVGLVIMISLFQALAPPDAFDALLYHLELPARILKDGGLHPYDITQFWFPGMPESTYLWVMALGSDRTPQLLHLAWMLIAAALVWNWARLWSDRAAWLSMVVLISMPSLPLVSSWAYTDFALTCMVVASLYSLYRYDQLRSNPWLILCGVFAGLAMGVKYTSFILPVSEVVLIFWWGRRNFRAAFSEFFLFSLVALIIAAPWYIRNWYLMYNPFYPFVFGGRYWDSLRAVLYAMKGTGIGWNLKEIVLLPLTATLGYRDANYYDGRIGPLFLLSIPLILFAYWEARREIISRKKSLTVIGIYLIISSLFWIYGVINTRSLWQVRLLYPSFFLMTIPAALGVLLLGKLDTAKFKVSSLFNIILATVVGISILENLVFFSARNPLSVELGTESEAKYLGRVIPGYAQMLELIKNTPPDSKIISLFEPRSYHSPRLIQPDPVVDQLARDINSYGDAQGVVDAWRSQGYSYAVIYRWGVKFLEKDPTSVLTPEREEILNQITQNYLKLVGNTPDGDYELYAIPPAQ
jgi:Dolichyl-phosphate-mannose-protein mannosyltransferase